MATHPLRTISRHLFRHRWRAPQLRRRRDDVVTPPSALGVSPAVIAAADRMMLRAAHGTMAARSSAPDPLIATFAGPP